MNLTPNTTRVALLLTCILLSGCGGISLNHDYYDFSDVYGKSINKQLLLNLARLSRDEPPYFLQLSQFTNQHNIAGSLGLNPKTANIGKGSGLTELDGMASLMGSEQPVFTFLPLTGDPFGQAFTTPLNTKIFCTFYDQNVPADMLARTMIQSVDVTVAKDLNDDTSREVRTLINDPLDPTYRDFLVWCYLLRTYQLNHELTVQIGPPKDKAKTIQFSGVSISDYTKAIDYNLSIAKDPKSPMGTTDKGPNYVCDAWIDEARFVATHVAVDVPDRTDFSFSFVVEKPKRTDIHKNRVTRALMLESLGASTKYPKLNGAQVKMRTFFSVMQGLAKEQQEFAEASKQNDSEYFVNDLGGRYGKSIWTKRNDPNVAPICASPLLVLQSDVSPRAGAHEEILTAINYTSREFKIADEVDDNNVLLEKADLVSPNRQVFGLVSYLFNLITIDPKKLPVQQLIQVQ